MKILVFFTMAMYFILLVQFGQIEALGFTALWIVFASAFFFRLFYRRKLKTYGLMLENIYVCQQSETDKKVMVRAEEHQRLIQLSGNEMGIEVKTIFFQDAANCNETWEEYIDRRDAFIANDRILRHQELESTQGRSYYLKELHGQQEAKGGRWYRVIFNNH